ncbi:hypothetical protein ACLIYP_00085 [Streptomyces nanhaiensis]|uniref:hypothetical protein n=1 Tax=Streptomyces nanhaiensis TaxID=679319 RepID=UPI00399CD1FE
MRCTGARGQDDASVVLAGAAAPTADPLGLPLPGADRPAWRAAGLALAVVGLAAMLTGVEF